MSKIGKTRQANADEAAAGPARGILRRTAAAPAALFKHTRRVPADAELRTWVQHYWTVAWDLAPGTQHTVDTLPHPNVHLVFTGGGAPAPTALVHGVPNGKFTRVLTGRARVFGIKFRPGGFRGFYGRPVSALRGKTFDASLVFRSSPALGTILPVLTGPAPESEKIHHADAFLRSLGLPPPDPSAELAGQAVDTILARPDLRSVDALARAVGLSVRAVQRLFRDYVGATPKWVIRRYRLHELIERLNSGDAAIDWAATALDLGYFDQSHLIADFRRATGYSPERFRRQPTREPGTR